MKHKILFVSLALALAVPVNANAQFEMNHPGCALALQMQQKYATKVPIAFACRFENQSKAAWPSFTVNVYPPFVPGNRLRVQVFNKNGDPVKVEGPSNQLTLFGFSQVMVPFPPGESRTVPLAIQSLPAGSYKLVLEGKHSATFDVVDSPELRKAVVKKQIEGYWSGDEFFSHVLRMTARDTGHRDVYKDVEEEVAKALGSDDPTKAVAAAKFLWPNLKPCQPEVIEKHLADAVALRCKDNDIKSAGKWYKFLCESSHLASRLGSEKALSIALEIMDREPPLGDNAYANVRAAAAFDLQPFKQKKAGDKLYRVASSATPGDEMATYQAAHALCVRNDPRALGVLLKLFQDENFRGYKGKILFSATALHDNPAVDGFIRNAASDPDPTVRGDAEAAAIRLRQVRENHQKK
jgi:hypothetical protein